MTMRGTVDCRDHRHLDVQVVHQEMFALVADTIPCGRFQVRRTCERRIGAEALTSAGQDYDFVFEVARDVGEQIRELLMRAAAPSSSLPWVCSVTCRIP